MKGCHQVVSHMGTQIAVFETSWPSIKLVAYERDSQLMDYDNPQ
jgi:hypothetical protein